MIPLTIKQNLKKCIQFYKLSFVGCHVKITNLMTNIKQVLYLRRCYGLPLDITLKSVFSILSGNVFISFCKHTSYNSMLHKNK